jgi:enoyl-CoA hydratase/carnithine racemase
MKKTRARYSEAYLTEFVTDAREEVTRCRKPVMAVADHALGAGCELAMMCDLISPPTPRASANPRSR